ncbi:tetratricopeptide repeat protein, partial [Methanocorpusculum bavaricum]|uniref:tetratricopeptide repeat protein n=1 Tax=Methanocorpusculum bavaricum TaxID=71518 RepID=UPI0005B25C10
MAFSFFNKEKRAVEQCTKAAEQGDAHAQNNLGASYEDGEGVEKDLDKAAYWYTKAAEQGNAEAQNNLGVCYENGKGVEKDLNKAIYWY